MAKRYTPKFKFQVVKEVLTTSKGKSEVARSYGVHPNTVQNWMNDFEEKGADIFGKDGTVAEYEKKIAEMEQLLGKKEMEIALLKNFFLESPKKK